MRVILKRYVTRDPSGRTIAVRVERVTDDEAGRTHLTDERTAHACTGCGHWMTGIDQRRGTCQVCERYDCCERCAARCQVCRRQLCGRCRHGFVGSPSQTTCVSCLATLMARQRIDDQRQLAAVEFERRTQHERFLQQTLVQRLQVQHAQASLQLEAARLGMQFLPLQPQHRGRWAPVIRVVKWLARGIANATGVR